MIFNINSTRGQTRFLTCVARVTCLVRNKRSTKLGAVFYWNLRTTVHNSAQLRCFENGNDDFGVEAFWIGDAARVGYFVPLNGPLNGHPPSVTYNYRPIPYFVRYLLDRCWLNRIYQVFHATNQHYPSSASGSVMARDYLMPHSYELLSAAYMRLQVWPCSGVMI